MGRDILVAKFRCYGIRFGTSALYVRFARASVQEQVTLEMSSAAFQPLDWALVTSVAMMWGSSFLFIKEALVTLRPGAVVFLRVTFGSLTLSLAHLALQRKQNAYTEAIACAGLRQIALLGLIWMAAPLAAVAIGQQWVGTGLAGMIFASPPVWGTVVNAAFTRVLPGRNQSLGLLLGFLGVVLILLPSIQRGVSSSVLGLCLMVGAAVSVAVGSCVAAPLQRQAVARAGPLGFLPALVLSQLAAAAFCAPFGVYGLLHSSVTLGSSASQLWRSIGSEAALGCLSTGCAYLCVACLIGRVGPSRGLLGNYFLPVVSALEGWLLYGERIEVLSVAGACVVTAGAWLTSRKGGASEGERMLTRSSSSSSSSSSNSNSSSSIGSSSTSSAAHSEDPPHHHVARAAQGQASAAPPARLKSRAPPPPPSGTPTPGASPSGPSHTMRQPEAHG